MSVLSLSASETSSSNYATSADSQFQLVRWQQLSSLLILLSLICAPISGMPSSQDQEKRGIGVTSAPKEKPSSATAATPGDKPGTDTSNRTHEVRQRGSFQSGQLMVGIRR